MRAGRDARASVEEGPWDARQNYWCQSLSTAYERRSWFPLPAEGEPVEGAFLVTMRSTAGPTTFNGTSTLLVTPQRVAGVCATGGSSRGPLHPEAGPVVVWDVPRDFGGWARLEFDNGSGQPRLTITPPGWQEPMVVIDDVQRVAGDGYAACAPGDLVRVLAATMPADTPADTPAPSRPVRQVRAPVRAPVRVPAPRAEAWEGEERGPFGLTLVLALFLAATVGLAPVFSSEPLDVTPLWEFSALNGVIEAWKLFFEVPEAGLSDITLALSAMCLAAAITLAGAAFLWMNRSSAAASVVAAFGVLTAGAAAACPAVAGGWTGDTFEQLGPAMWAALVLGPLAAVAAVRSLRALPDRNHGVAVGLVVAAALGVAIAFGTTRPDF